MIDHLFRHQYGNMVSVLTRIFGLRHLSTIEDAVQDTFINAIRSWQGSAPDNPEGWLMHAAKNRVVDLFRKIAAENQRIHRIENGLQAIAIHELFLDHEIADSVLRMIFTACNPQLKAQDQIAFSLKTISGFSRKEIAAALMLKDETVKKRLIRARKAIQCNNLDFAIPTGKELTARLERVLEVIYLIFNEGFHSIRKDILVRKDLCGEAFRLVRMLVNHKITSQPHVHALAALFCFQLARLSTKVGDQNEVISLAQQKRSSWDNDLIARGHLHMEMAVDTSDFGYYHYEAAIAAEHVKARTYSETDWDQILIWYNALDGLGSSPINQLNMAVIHLEMGNLKEALGLLETLNVKALEQRTYLYYGTFASYYKRIGLIEKAIRLIDQAIDLVTNESERKYLEQKRTSYIKIKQGKTMVK